jgi:hypothetical protein
VTSLTDELQAERQAARVAVRSAGPFSAKVVKSPADYSSAVYVTIPSFDRHKTFGPCLWAAQGGDLPQPGDSCIVLIDDQNRMWVVQWWPQVPGGGGDGTPGPPGPTGPAGPQGPEGPAGPQGIPGPTGPSGATGVAGPKGDKGDTGATGAAGATGSQGPQGVAGPTGPQGATGAQGPQGTTGAQGPQGNPGATGAAGATGPAGPGVPVGGATGQVLTKTSATDYATSWQTPAAATGYPFLLMGG